MPQFNPILYIEERVKEKAAISVSALCTIRRELILQRELVRAARQEREEAMTSLAELETEFEEQSALLVFIRRERIEAEEECGRYKLALETMRKEVAKLRDEVIDFKKEHTKDHAGRTAENQESVGSA